MSVSQQAASSRLSLRANFSWTFAGNVVYAGSQWGMLTALAKLGTPEMVGQFALGLAVTAPVVMFTNLQLRGVQATDARREYEFGHYLGLRLIGTLLALICIVGIILFIGYPVETAMVILVIGLAKVFESISDVFYGLLQQHERMDCIARSMMIKGPLSMIALGAGVHLTGGVLWGAIGVAVTWAVLLVLYDIPCSKRIQDNTSLRPNWSAAPLLRLACLALPLGAVMLLISLNTNIPRYFLEHYRGEYELGIFAALTYLIVAATMIVSALGQSVSPRLSTYYANGYVAEFQTLLLKLLGVAGLLGVVGMGVTLLLGKQILSLLYSPEYADHNDVFLLVMLAGAVGFVASFLGYAMTAARCFRAQLPLFSVVVVCTLLCSGALIPARGLLAAALVLVIAATLQCIGSALVVSRALWVLKK